MKIWEFTVTGVFCPKCVAKLEQVLGPVAGVRGLTVSEDYSIVRLEVDNAAPAAPELARLIETVPGKEFRVLATAAKEV